MIREIDISNYYPNTVRNTNEFKILAEVINPVIRGLWGEIQEALDNQFIETATKTGLERRENMLCIVAGDTDTLEERRFRILSKYNMKLPYTITRLKEMLANLCGDSEYRVNLLNDRYILNVSVEWKSEKIINELKNLLERVVPANLTIIVNLFQTEKANLYVAGVFHQGDFIKLGGV